MSYREVLPARPTEASKRGVPGRIIRLESPGYRVESPATNACAGSGAVYADCRQVIEGIDREPLQVRTKINTRIPVSIGLSCHSAQEIGEVFACCCRKLIVVVELV